MSLSRVSVRVPASTSNLGPGFDCLGLALNLYNTTTISREPDAASRSLRHDRGDGRRFLQPRAGRQARALSLFGEDRGGDSGLARTRQQRDGAAGRADGPGGTGPRFVRSFARTNPEPAHRAGGPSRQRGTFFPGRVGGVCARIVRSRGRLFLHARAGEARALVRRADSRFETLDRDGARTFAAGRAFPACGGEQPAHGADCRGFLHARLRRATRLVRRSSASAFPAIADSRLSGNSFWPRR